MGTSGDAGVEIRGTEWGIAAGVEQEPGRVSLRWTEYGERLTGILTEIEVPEGEETYLELNPENPDIKWERKS